jgi:hypothetical protein
MRFWLLKLQASAPEIFTKAHGSFPLAKRMLRHLTLKCKSGTTRTLGTVASLFRSSKPAITDGWLLVARKEFQFFAISRSPSSEAFGRAACIPVARLITNNEQSSYRYQFTFWRLFNCIWKPFASHILYPTSKSNGHHLSPLCTFFLKAGEKLFVLLLQWQLFALLGFSKETDHLVKNTQL